MALLGSINGIAPVCAPVVGGLVASVASWQWVFGLLLLVGIVLMICSAFLKETLPTDRRIHKNLLQVYANLFRVFRNPCFTLPTAAAMACMFAFFGYISSSPFILQQLYGLSPLAFSICFGLNAVMIAIGAAVATRFKQYSEGLKWGAANMTVAAVGLAISLALSAPFVVVMACYIYMLTGFGLMQPGLTALALDSERANAGAASAIFGASGFVAGAIASPLVGIGTVEMSSSLVIVGGAFVCLLLVWVLNSQIKSRALYGKTVSI